MEPCAIRILRHSPLSPLYRFHSGSRPLLLLPTPARRQLHAAHALCASNKSNKSKKNKATAKPQLLRDVANMTTTAQLVTAPTADTPGACIHVRHDRGNYIFGRIAEGTQRAFNSRKVGFSGVTDLFLSGPVGWDQLGGMTGFLLTVSSSVTASRESLAATNAERTARGLKPLAGASHDSIAIHAGDNLSHVLATSRSYVFRQAVRARLSEQRDDPRVADPRNLEPDWTDGILRVWKVPVARERSSSPRKRRRMSNETKEQEEDDEQEAARRATSDPTVAKLIIERGLWNGLLQTPPLEAHKAKDVKDDQTAFVTDTDGSLKRFTRDSVDPDAKVWVLPDAPSEDGKPRYGVETRGLSRFPLPKTAYTQTAMSYIVRAPDRRGKFDRAAAEKLGVRRHDFKLLIDGKSVPGAEGATITPDMVLGQGEPGRGFVVADIPGPEYLESFLARPEWTTPQLMDDIAVVYWLLAPGLAANERLRAFMADRPGIKHVVCAPDTSPNMVSNAGTAELQMTMRRIDPDRFPILQYNNESATPAAPAGSDVEYGRAGKKTQLMPKLQHSDDDVAPFADLVTPYRAVPDEALALAQAAKERAADPEFAARVAKEEDDIPSRDAEVVALGTGSSVPSKYRNVSATLMRVPGLGNYLLDCGEGTLGQLRRLYGEEGTAEVLRGLRCVAISHLHADHHLGAPSVLRAWYEQSVRDGTGDARLAVVCIPKYRATLAELAQVEDFGMHRLHFPHCEDPKTYGGGPECVVLGAREREEFGLRSTRLVPVVHCAQSKAVQLEMTTGLRVAYSGDCRPSAEFASACRGAHLLVHECTFDDDMASHARAKQHSTMSEALGVARDMGARRTLLTHFSQRYVKADSLGMAAREAGMPGPVLFAFDHMAVRLGDFQQAACYLPALEKVIETAAE